MDVVQSYEYCYFHRSHNSNAIHPVNLILAFEASLINSHSVLPCISNSEHNPVKCVLSITPTHALIQSL